MLDVNINIHWYVVSVGCRLANVIDGLFEIRNMINFCYRTCW